MKKEFPIKPIKEVKTKKKSVVPPKPSIDKGKVPLFDPYTGEPNPKYLELTGEINPLLLNWKKEDFYNVPQNFEPKLKNRFLVIFPEVLNVKPYYVSEVRLPSTEVKTGLFGQRSYLTSSFEIKMIDRVSEPKLGLFHAWFKDYTTFDLSIEQLDAQNIVIQKIELKGCNITQIDCDAMSYNSKDNMTYNYKLTISPNDMIIN